MQSQTISKVGVYARVARADEERIKTQCNNILEFAKNQGFADVLLYTDNGFSGSNFNRPAFEKMMEEVIKGNINCIITEDYSRLGRNYIEVSQFVDKILKNQNVRLICVNDNLDTFSLNKQTGNRLII